MSGQQIGTVVGGIIGAYFGEPQLGMAIGGLIGGAIDPEKIYGPHIGQAGVHLLQLGPRFGEVGGGLLDRGDAVPIDRGVEAGPTEHGDAHAVHPSLDAVPPVARVVGQAERIAPVVPGHRQIEQAALI